MTAGREVWAAGDAYEAYVGRWSRLVAREFLAWLAPPPGARWLDLGCGSGALSQAIRATHAPARLVAADRSERFVRHVRHALRGDPGDAGAAGFVVADAVSLPLRTGSLDAAVSGLVLNFVASPGAALAELRRSVRPGGLVAVYLWDYAGRMQLMRAFWDAAAALDPAAAALDEGVRFPLCEPGRLRALFEEAGLEAIAVTPLEVTTRFRDFDDCWQPFLGGQGPAPGYVASLPESRRRALREALRARLPITADGSIALAARAWAARGRA